MAERSDHWDAEFAGLVFGAVLFLAIKAVRLGFWLFRRPWWALAVWLAAPFGLAILAPSVPLAGWAALRLPVAEVLLGLCAVDLVTPRLVAQVRQVRRRRQMQRVVTATSAVVAAPQVQDWASRRLPAPAARGIAAAGSWVRLRRRLRHGLPAGPPVRVKRVPASPPPSRRRVLAGVGRAAGDHTQTGTGPEGSVNEGEQS